MSDVEVRADRETGAGCRVRESRGRDSGAHNGDDGDCYVAHRFLTLVFEGSNAAQKEFRRLKFWARRS